MSDLLVLGLKLLFLALLWLFVLFAVNVIRTDLFGRRVPAAAPDNSFVPGFPAPAVDAWGATPAAPAATASKRGRAKRTDRKLPTVLRIIEGPRAGASMPLADTILIGRTPDATLDLGDEFQSTRHAVISRTPTGYVVTDLGSTNGTHVNGRLITEPTAIGPDDAVRIGRTTLIVDK